jgi:hypothetical protein
LGAPIGYAWLCILGVSLLFSAQSASRRSLQVEEYAFACDAFGYLVMAQQIRHAVSELELPQFHLESPQTKLLIDFMRSSNLPLASWDELVAPHAHHYFPKAGRVGVQYPPGTGIALALFPEGEAVQGLNRTVIWLLLLVGIAALILAGARRSWISAGFVTLAVVLGLGIVGRIGDRSFSINAMLAPLLLSALCLCAALGLRSREERWRPAWCVSLLGGCVLGFAILIRLPVMFLVPGFLALLWPESWRPHMRLPIFAFGLGMLLSGILPLLAHQYGITGAWYLPTYNRSDTAPPSLEPLRANLAYYLGTGPGSQDNWVLVVLFVGFVGLFALRTRHHPTRSGIDWKRIGVSVVILWGFPTAYFLTHPHSAPYYSTPATFGAVTLLALGAFTIESFAVDTTRRGGCGKHSVRCWIALAVALLPGIATVGHAVSSYPRTLSPLQVQARRLVLPAELSEGQAWVWADLLSGTLWYYARKPAFKISFSDAGTRALVYRFVFERNERQYIIRDTPGMQPLMDEISHMGGVLEPRGTVGAYPYFAIRWPEGGPRYAR